MSFHAPILSGLLVTFLVLSAPASHAVDQPPDGYTAWITFPGSFGDVVIAPASGGYEAQVQIFSNASGSWQPIVMQATFRVWEDTATGGVDRVSIPFTSSASGPVSVAFPDVFGPATLDVFVTFSALGGDPVPTSHHHLAKNLAIAQGDFGTADSLDHHSTRVWAT